MHRAALASVFLLIVAGCSHQREVAIGPNRVAEISLTAARVHGDPFNELEVEAVVTTPSGKTLRVPAFWDGGADWRFRYASGEIGVHRFRTECSDAADNGLHGVAGTIDVRPRAEEAGNPLYAHGPVRVAADRRHFEHADGTPFFWLADTWWMGLCQRLRWPEDFQALTKDRREKGFTVVQIVAGLYPDMPAFDPRGANEAGFPWERDYGRINPAYFDAADRRIAWLCDNGISPCIVAAWGYHLPWLGVERMKRHWRYLVARYGAYPVFWCVAGEGAMPYYLSQHKERDVEFQKKGWTQVAAYLKAIDPYNHPVSIHPTDASRTQLLDPSLLDFDMLQTGHSDRASIPRTMRLVSESVAATQPVMPTINAEVCYEGILNTCPADVVRFMAWACVLSGAAGHTYGANGIWQVNVAGHPYGKSPHGGDWGQTPWDQAMRLPGSAQVGLMRRVLADCEWWRFRPHPEWASYDDPSEKRWGAWIWYPEGDPAKDAPLAKRYFRKTFELAGAAPRQANLYITADDKFTVYVNGQCVGEHENWWQPQRYDVTKLLRTGRNVIAVQAENLPDPEANGHNPAGLNLGLNLVQGGEAAGQIVSRIMSDETWRCADGDRPGWSAVDFDDSSWTRAKVVARAGQPPWERFRGDGPFGPFCSGIEGRVRVIYFGSDDPAHLRALPPGAHRAWWVSPTDGQRLELGALRPGSDGMCRVPAFPAGWSDAALIIESDGTAASASAAASAAGAADFLPGVRRILFLGDSITYAGQYIDDFDTALRLHLPGRRFDMINCGLPSETVSGLSEPGHAGGQFPRPDLHERLERVLAAVKPDLVVACYGMNDGIYLPLDDGRFAKFKQGMTWLHEKVTASGARIVHLTPPVFDAAAISSRVAPADHVDADHPYESYDQVLEAYAKWLVGQRRAAGWDVIDLHGPMQRAIAQRRTAEPAFTFARDGIHPDDAGHRVMAAALLRGLGAPFELGGGEFGDPADPSSPFSRVSRLVRERNRLLTDAWLTETRHRRPMPEGLPMDQAQEKAAAIDRDIAELLAK